MTITIDGNSLTGSNPHGTITAEPWEYDRVQQSFFGLTGEINLLGGLKARNLSAWLLLTGFSTHALLHAQIETVNALINTTGNLVWTVGADVDTHTNAVFNGLTLDEEPWLDGSGVNGWQVLGRLHFRHIKS